MDMDNADHSRAAARLVDVNGLFEKTFHQHLARARGVSAFGQFFVRRLRATRTRTRGEPDCPPLSGQLALISHSHAG